MVSLVSCCRMASGTMPPCEMSAAAVAYDENALANNKMRLPKKAGASIGIPMRRPIGEPCAAERGVGLGPGGFEALHGGHECQHHQRNLKVEIGNHQAGNLVQQRPASR